MKFPAVFLGHGSPMNAIDNKNPFNNGFSQMAKNITAKYGKPQAILMISAHWYGRDFRVMTGENNPIIYDFYGFPEALYQTQYPAKGSIALAGQVMSLLADDGIIADDKRGLDHGAWAVLRHFYPNADIPVVQLSLNLSKPASWHWQIAKKLSVLSDAGILIMGSGNIVHNLHELNFAQMDHSVAYDWAALFHQQINQAILTNDTQTLLDYQNLGQHANLSVPTPSEHYLPLLYVMAQREKNDNVQIFNDEIIGGSLSMTSVTVRI
ncbi:4,5-DOPA dioxygenase extradiol [Conservatibacter flavescens]|uniref:4,5-DOPA dioxygenase extradiol n=1 Tax=Conservatibacter flavescens TaxID=28161 RepID=A0A2M8S194_9PAST|nr:4,5-DOPA dioxygenase extradiol [Conservatibacter flavescens]PJG84910.1 4,5-DOPA dioxygenase extradiol [Conservatibacter flavescens]